MSEKEIKEIAKEEFMNNVMTNLDSTLIFTYIKTLEDRINKALDYLETFIEVDILVKGKMVQPAINILKGDDNNER